MKADYLVIGSGLAGSVFAQQAKEKGKSVLVVEKRDHIGGNVATEYKDGIHIHRYGGHILHCNDDGLWSYINRFGKIRQYTHKVKVNYQDGIYSFPINLETLYQIYGVVTTPEKMERALRNTREAVPGDNLEAWCVSQVGPKLYRTFIEGYTTKQWGRHPRDLPASIIKRIPIRTTWDDRYFSDKHQGVPEDGYSALIENMLDGVKVELGVDYFNERNRLDRMADHIIYTGPIDAYFDCSLGRLEYRSLRHKHELLDGDYQGCATVNYTSAGVPYTRVLEHKHYGWLGSRLPKTWVTWEYPAEYDGTNEPYYPIRDEKNTELYSKYKEMADTLPNVHFIGRLATYTYQDMIPTVAQALKLAKELNGN